ncbi:MAG TPA: hypothetical protein PLY12_01450 [Bacillota bacterium]|jgi:bacterioferritin (cytochrome b1)|nr:hypothetical protein [Bacillota bacterium]HQQ44456.1 hypothetical protein [Bacillota bacterium]
MNRIYSSYSEDEQKIIEKLAAEQGFTLSAFQKYCVMLYANEQGNVSPINELIDKMKSRLEEMEPNKPFIVSSLLPDEWPSLSRNDKMTISLSLKKYIQDHSTEFKINKKIRSNINQYIKY